MPRYLFYFSYIGTRFSGMQKQCQSGKVVEHITTVQSVFETALLKTNPLNKPILYPASRTDSGVHALRTAAHSDIDYANGNKRIETIIHTLNSFFMKNKHEIRVLDVLLVPSEFSARYSVVRKKYLYRFAVVKPGRVNYKRALKYLHPVPILEKDRCHFVFKPGFDEKAASKAAELFLGTKDFRAFMGKPKFKGDIETERNIEILDLKPGRPLASCCESDYFDFWEVHCQGRSFLYRQVRRIVSILIAVGLNHLTIDYVKHLFNFPTNETWDGKATVVPGCGLYLQNVEYRIEDLEFGGTDNAK